MSGRRRLLRSVAAEADPAAGRGSDDAPEMTARFAEYRATGDRSIRNELVERHRSLADALARRYADRGEPLDDLVQVALLGLVKAVERFDPDKGIPFAGFAVPTVTGELRRHFRDHTWAVKVHRRAKDLHVRIPAASDRLTAALGRTPTPAELAEEVGCSIDELIEALDAGTAYRTTSTDTVEGGLAATFALERAVGAPAVEAEDRLQLAQLLSDLPERDQLIVALRFFEDLSQSEIAERVGVSQVHVSRLLRAALAQMRSSAEEAVAG